MRCTPVRYISVKYTPMRRTRKVHIHEVHTYKTHPVRYISMKYTPMRCTPVRYTLMRYTPMRCIDRKSVV